MPTKRIRKARTVAPQLSDAILHFLADGLFGAPDPGGFKAYQVRSNREKQLALWQQHRDAILSEWISARPGTRPAMWWKFDAPRIPNKEIARRNWPGWVSGDDLPEPRRRLGGVGDPDFEHFAIVPEFPYGLPSGFISWCEDDDEEDRIGQPIDPDDPPRYESQAAYLRRHGLLTPAEKRRLRARDFKPQLVTENEENGR